MHRVNAEWHSRNLSLYLDLNDKEVTKVKRKNFQKNLKKVLTKVIKYGIIKKSETGQAIRFRNMLETLGNRRQTL